MNKYKKLENDLREAYEIAKEAATGDDGGTANLDSTFLKLKGWGEKKVLEAIKNAGLYCRGKTEWIGTGYMINTGGGQGNDRMRVRNKFLSVLEEKGYKVLAYNQMD